MIRTVPISEVTDYAYGPDSSLKNYRTWWGHPLYDIDEVMERMTANGLTKADRYPNGKICHLKAIREFTRSEVEASVLSGPKPQPKLNVVDALIENFQATILIGTIITAAGVYAWVNYFHQV